MNGFIHILYVSKLWEKDGVTVSASGWARLLRDENGYVSGGTITTPKLDVLAVVSWLGIDAHAKHHRDPNAPLVLATSLNYRAISAGVEYYWNGATWELATLPAHWNTAQELFVALPQWAHTELALRVQFVTTDPNFTPSVRSFNVAVQLPSDYDVVDDLIRHGFLRRLRSIAGRGRVRVVSDGTNSLDWSAITSQFERRYDEKTVLDVWNQTTDEYHRQSILDSVVGDAVNLNTTPTNGDVLELSFSYSPRVALVTDQDYIVAGVFDTAQVPAILIEKIEQRSINTSRAGREAVINHATGESFVMPSYRSIDVKFGLVVETGLEFDLINLVQDVLNELNSDGLTLPGIGIEIEMMIGDTHDQANINVIGSKRARLHIEGLNIPVLDRELAVVQAVTSLEFEVPADWTPHDNLEFVI